MDSEELSSTFVNKIPQTNSIRHFIVKTNWQTDKIDLQILDNHESKEWEGSISIDELKQSAEELEIPYEKFLNECKDALTRNGGIDHFQYLMDDDKFTLTKDDEFQIQYLEVPMKSSYGLQNSLTLTAVDLIASLRGELSTVERESNGLNEKYKIMVNTLERRLEEKNQLERRLLRKFAVLLNAKKDKIAELQDLLVEKSNKLEEAGLSGEQSGKRNLAEMQGNSVVNVDDDFMGATQVMTQPVVTLPKRKKFNPADGVVVRRRSLSKGVSGSSTGIQEKVSADVTNEVDMEDSPDLFDQI